MAAPTPVSTLVHSSTLVTAGVYVLVRFRQLFDEFIASFLLVVSIITVVMAGRRGLAETDIKKVVALSTLRQVGIIMFAVSIGAVIICFFHLVVHAFFKALIFMCVGRVIFYRGGTQDARFLRGLWFKLPLTCSLLLFTNLSLIGFPFMSGFYSKELILASCLLGDFPVVGFLMLFMSLVLTIGYGFRIVVLTVRGTVTDSVEHYTEINIYYLLAVSFMRGGSVFFGLLIQLIGKDLIFYLPVNPSIFYGTLLLSIFWAVNAVGLITMVQHSSRKKVFNYLLRDIWFLKRLRGNLLRRRRLRFIRKMVRFVEIGWIRGYV